jgi:hypothetical protein
MCYIDGRKNKYSVFDEDVDEINIIYRSETGNSSPPSTWCIDLIDFDASADYVETLLASVHQV